MLKRLWPLTCLLAAAPLAVVSLGCDNEPDEPYEIQPEDREPMQPLQQQQQPPAQQPGQEAPPQDGDTTF